MAAHAQHIERFAKHQRELAQIEKLIASSALHDCESLCHLLRFLGDKSLGEAATPPNEYEIAAEVFRRGVNFDPKNDSTVRVNMGRLRSRIADYYASDGAHDQVVLEIPARSYSVLFLYRSLAEAEPVVETEEDENAGGSGPKRKKLLVSFVLIFLISTAMIGYFVVRARSRTNVSASSTPNSLAIFWKDFLEGPTGPLVVFSNKNFIGNSRLGMRYYRPNEDPPGMVLDQYTGVGEVMGVDALDHLFFRFHRDMRVRRALNMPWDDAKVSNLIFLGSQAENEPEMELPYTPEFVFGQDSITNSHPRTGELSVYSAYDTHPQTEDIALISLHSGLVPGHRILVLAGARTLGTEAAAEFVCLPSSVQGLLSKLDVPRGGQMPNFEAVLRVRVSGGVPIRTDLLTVHSGLK